jgi:hypothetical protein
LDHSLVRLQGGTVPNLIGSGLRDAVPQDPSNPDPIHEGKYASLAAVDGVGGINISGPYEPVLGWPEEMHPGEWKPGSGRGVYAESPDRVIVVYGGEVELYKETSVWGPNIIRDLRFTEINSRLNPTHRHCHEILFFNRDGKLIDSLDRHFDVIHENDLKDGGSSHSGHINRLRMNRYDPEHHVWIVGQGNTGIFKFTNDGHKLVFKIDAHSVPKEYHPLFFEQDIAFLPNGDFLVAHRHFVMRFSEDGSLLSTFGAPGHAPGEFYGIHGIEVHPETLDIYINDRLNNRIQVFDQHGALKEVWPGFQGTYTIRLTEDGGHMWVGNALVQKFAKYDMSGRLIPESTWGTFGIAPGTIWGPHFFDTDIEGNLYVAEDYSGRVQKFRPMENVDPANPQLIGRLNR